MAQDGVDLAALQQQLQQRRSALADQILSHLPQDGGAAKAQPAPAPRPARLGVGAEAQSAPQLSAADQRLKAQLTGKKRSSAQTIEAGDEDDEEDTKGSSVGKKSRRVSDPFAKASAKAPPPPPPQDTTLSKAQRKKLNKKRRLEEQAAAADNSAIGKGAPVQEASAKGASPKDTLAKDAPPMDAPSKDAPSKEPSKEGPSAPALTSLQSSMLTSLKGARFRSINEKLYTSSSSDALALMRDEPQTFAEYHDGFRQQVRKWPHNPVDVIARLLQGKGKKGRNVRAARPGALVVDLGAGEAGLARQLVPTGVHVLSYDLVDTDDGWVRGVDAARLYSLPLPGKHEPLGISAGEPSAAVADVAVFCLSLMGTNWLEMIIEARRVLRTGGELIVAEVTSRFGPDGASRFADLVCSVGFGLDWQDTTDNTHFALFKFTKKTRTTDTLVTKGSASADALGALSSTDAMQAEAKFVQEGCAVLRPCLYKRR
ncbi:25S rRNA (adenine(645)-N(1))-methyltransferase [Malassezia cuniculi]|uniref:Ribosomal RNA-processing protein 8 n=1 Tax=Malassezia cuniculi TaxID=948313 RepID=A0AAF0EU64_9BASI|nr:25S rRNA (adenine(645)-N(1))-methyltransferase [Malassezia cuniculi]